MAKAVRAIRHGVQHAIEGEVPQRVDAEVRRDLAVRHAVEVLQAILKHPIPFDAFAPEAARKSQLSALRELFERKAG